jgi:uncharacterized protein (TIGR00730 family)
MRTSKKETATWKRRFPWIEPTIVMKGLNMNRVICVYSSSSNLVDKIYFKTAEELGAVIAKNGDFFLNGGSTIGLMGASAKAVHAAGGKVIGIIPKMLNIKGVVYEYCDELIEACDLRERKSLMDSRSDAFIALPGGFGTLEELMEIISLKQLKCHNKPIVILNVGGFYDKLIELFNTFIQCKFVDEVYRTLFFVTEDVEEAIRYIDSYVPPHYSDKWTTTEKLI